MISSLCLPFNETSCAAGTSNRLFLEVSGPPAEESRIFAKGFSLRALPHHVALSSRPNQGRMQTVPNYLLPVKIQSVLLPYFSANLISTPSGGADWPNSYFESWAWLMPRTLANSSWVVPALNCRILPPTPRKSTSLSDRRGRPPNFLLTIFILRVFFLRVRLDPGLGSHGHQRW